MTQVAEHLLHFAWYYGHVSVKHKPTISMMVNFYRHTADASAFMWDNSKITGPKGLKDMMSNPFLRI